VPVTSGRDFTREEFSRVHLEMLALARCCARPDWTAANAVIDGMELPSGAYISAAGLLLAQLAERIGPTTDHVLDEMTRGIIKNAAEGPPPQ
jgi:hypothetical protein